MPPGTSSWGCSAATGRRPFPVRAPGYMEVGRVSETSSDAASPSATWWPLAYGHKTAHTVDPAV